MSLHSELMVAGSELLAMVLGTPGGAVYYPPHGNPHPLDLVSTGQVTVEEEVVPTGRGLEQTRRMEKLTLVLADPPELALTGRIQLAADDEAEIWEIAGLRGRGTANVTVDLQRIHKMATGRGGRHQKMN